MSGKDLFESMSRIDDRFVEEAEVEILPRRKSAPWRGVASMAACLCLILGGAAVLGHYGNHNAPPVSRENQSDAEPIIPSIPKLPPVVTEVTTTNPVAEVPSVILLVDRMTPQGFIGTVAELVDTDLFEIGMELNVVFADGILQEAVLADADEYKSQNADYAGFLVSVQFIHYDPESETILVNIINQIEPGKDD